ncbi:MAG: ABC-2 family transporter protein [Anaerolineae bacterium]|nr:ABC-2 family transporter protein [Anaerolineae bacterium]
MLKKYPTLLRASWALMLEFRGEIVMWMMSSAIAFVMLLVWLSVAEANNGVVNGFASGDFITYFLISWAMRNLTAVWASWEMDAGIREGRLSPMLLRPMHPVHWDISQNIAEKALRACLVVPVVAVVTLFVPGVRIDWSISTVLAFGLSLVGAWFILFWSDYLTGLFAFWTSQVEAIILTWFGIRLILSGMIAPLAMFPASVQTALYWLPFRYTNSFSVEILTGRISGGELWAGFAIQAAWGLFFFVVSRIVWKIALRNYSAVGA